MNARAAWSVLLYVPILTCNRCGTTDPSLFRTPRGFVCEPCQRKIRNFHRSRSARKCAVATKARARAYYLAHHEEAKAKSRVYSKAYQAKRRSESPEVVRQRNRAWCAENKDKTAAYHRKWVAKNTEVMAEHARRRRAIQSGCAAKFSTSEWTVIKRSFGGACAYCLRADVKLTADHVVPLTSGGAHTADNIVPACQPCNSREGPRGILSMLRFQ